jgi:hypothetical protein
LKSQDLTIEQLEEAEVGKVNFHVRKASREERVVPGRQRVFVHRPVAWDPKSTGKISSGEDQDGIGTRILDEEPPSGFAEDSANLCSGQPDIRMVKNPFANNYLIALGGESRMLHWSNYESRVGTAGKSSYALARYSHHARGNIERRQPGASRQ